MGARRYHRGPARRDELRQEGEARQVLYDSLSLRQKINLQLIGNHNGRQLQKLYSKLEKEQS